MRFKASLIHSDVLAKILSALDKVSKSLILRLTPTSLHFIIAHATADSGGGMQVWGELASSVLFSDYRIESAAINNEIWLSISSTDDFIRALKSTLAGGSASQTASNVVMKLAKKQGQPVLSLEVAGNVSGKCFLVQDLPVSVLTTADKEALVEPVLPESDVNVILPGALLAMKSVVERLKSCCPILDVRANANGELILKVQAVGLSVETFYKGLVVPEIKDTEKSKSLMVQDTFRSKSTMYQVSVDAKDLIRMLSCHLFSPKHVVCSIVEEHSAVFFAYIGNTLADQGVITYMLPIRSADD